MGDVMGADLSVKVALCVVCETRRRRMGGRECFVCFREINGIQPPPVALAVNSAPRAVALAPSPTPLRRPARTAAEARKAETDRQRLVYRRKSLGCGDLPTEEVDRLWALAKRTKGVNT